MINNNWWIPLVEQLTATLALDRHQERQQQLIVMEERATIARELHDSIAQSLSCMKMQVSCLQMQGDALPESSRELLSQIRNELNASGRSCVNCSPHSACSSPSLDYVRRWRRVAKSTAPNLASR